jgi:hypothetical protein
MIDYSKKFSIDKKRKAQRVAKPEGNPYERNLPCLRSKKLHLNEKQTPDHVSAEDKRGQTTSLPPSP